MGCCCSTPSNQVPSSYGAKDHKAEKRIYKLLLLGIGSSGKSTIYKQLQLIHGQGIDSETIRDSSDGIRQNILLGIVKLLLSSDDLVNMSPKFADCKVDMNEEITKQAVTFVVQYRESLHHNQNMYLKDESEIDNGNYIDYNVVNTINKNYYDSSNTNHNNERKTNGLVSRLSSSINFELTHEQINWENIEDLKNALIYLWELPSIKNTFQHRNYFAFPDNMPYFLNQIDRIFDENYIPNQDDYIQSRIRTAGIISSRFGIPMGGPNEKNKNDKSFKMDIIDVGGQRNERRKWIYQFDGCTAVIFVAALNHYCSKLFEDETKNAMHESLLLFSEIFSSKWFRNSQMILFLNKHDLFCHKLKDTSLSVCFDKNNGWPSDQWLGPDFCDFADYNDYLQKLHSNNYNNNGSSNNSSKNNNDNENENSIKNGENSIGMNLDQHGRQISMTGDSDTGAHPQAVLQLYKNDSASQGNASHLLHGHVSHGSRSGNDNGNGNNGMQVGIGAHGNSDSIEYKVSDNIKIYDGNIEDYFTDPLFVECHRHALSFIARQYEKITQEHNQSTINQYAPKQLYTHVTTATDANVVERVFWDVQSILVRDNLRKGGLGLPVYP